jgi:hypothetical protein
MSGFSLAEQSYRRGYVHGARELLAAIERRLPADQRAMIERWLEGDLSKWRLENLRGKTGRNKTGLVARFSQIEGYRCLSLMRALGVVKCQLALA